MRLKVMSILKMLIGIIYTISKIIIIIRNTNPPIPTIQKKVLQQFLQPRTFEESEENYDSHFDGWSFINNDDRANKSNQV